MASYINVFLKTEITVIPSLLDKYIGKYYNNTLCNGATWMFLSWYILHVIFDDLLNALLKKMRYKEYIRIRLKRSLWYSGFYSTASIYCIATFLRNDVQFYDVKKPFDSTNTPSGHLILGFIVLSTFYLHSAFWERLKYCHNILASNFLCLFLFMCFSYFLRFVEGTFRLTILISNTQIALEIARCTVILLKKEGFSRKLICGTFFAFSNFFFTINYLVVMSVLLDPLIRGLSPSSAILASFLFIWLVLEIYESVLFKTILHWMNHKEKLGCEKDIFECALFPPRNDATYNFLILRKEIKEREEKCLSLRRPKNRNMVMQTLKCMVAIKRKLHEKRQTANSPVKEDNENTTSLPATLKDNENNTKDTNNAIKSNEKDCDDNSDNKNEANNQKSNEISVQGQSTSLDGHRQINKDSLVDGVLKINIQKSDSDKNMEFNGHIKKYKED